MFVNMYLKLALKEYGKVMLLQPSAVNYHKIYHDWTTHNEQHTEQDKFSAILQNGPIYIFYLLIPLSDRTETDLKLLFWVCHFHKWIT